MYSRWRSCSTTTICKPRLWLQMVVVEQLCHLLYTSRSSNHCPRSRSFFNLSPSSINCNMDEWSLRPLGCLPVTKTSQDDQHEVSSRILQARMRMYEDRRGWVKCMVFNLRFKEWKLTYTMKGKHSTENLYYHDFSDSIQIYVPNPISLKNTLFIEWMSVAT